MVDLITGSYPQVCLEEMQLKRIISQHIVLWLSALNGYGWNTKQNALTLCRRIFDAGIEWGRIVRNPHSRLGYLSPENYVKHQKVSP